MTKYREILRLHSLGISQRGIAASCSSSRKTIIKVLKRAKELNIAWPLPAETTDGELDKLFFPKSDNSSMRRHPDMEYIHREMSKSGVTLKLLWSEYMEECRLNHELPLMYSQFCYHFKSLPRPSVLPCTSLENRGNKLKSIGADRTLPLLTGTPEKLFLLMFL